MFKSDWPFCAAEYRALPQLWRHITFLPPPYFTSHIVTIMWTSLHLRAWRHLWSGVNDPWVVRPIWCYDWLLFLEVTLRFFVVRLVEVGKMSVVDLQFDELMLHRCLVQSHLVNVNLTADAPHCDSLDVTTNSLYSLHGRDTVNTLQTRRRYEIYDLYSVHHSQTIVCCSWR